MKGLVNSVTPENTWEAHGKTFHNFKISIGEHSGQYSTPKFTDPNAPEFPFKTGTEAEYEYVDGDHPKIKLPKKDFNAPSAYKRPADDSARQEMIVRQSSLTRAVEILIHNSNQTSIVDGTTITHDINPSEAEELAERFAKWVMQTAPAKGNIEKLQERLEEIPVQPQTQPDPMQGIIIQIEACTEQMQLTEIWGKLGTEDQDLYRTIFNNRREALKIKSL